MIQCNQGLEYTKKKCINVQFEKKQITDILNKYFGRTDTRMTYIQAINNYLFGFQCYFDELVTVKKRVYAKYTT